MKVFAEEKLLMQHYFLNYKIDLYFPETIDETGNKERKENKENKKEKEIKKNFIASLL